LTHNLVLDVGHKRVLMANMSQYCSHLSDKLPFPSSNNQFSTSVKLGAT
jgi:hypothetical protein